MPPHWLTDPGLPVFCWEGRGVTRELVSDLLKTAASALGYPPHLIGSHSLRKGGATAMLASTGDLEAVKRFGGWKSDAVHAYLYADHQEAPNRSSSMLESNPVLHPSQRARSAHDSRRCGCLVGQVSWEPLSSTQVSRSFQLLPCPEPAMAAPPPDAWEVDRVRDWVWSGRNAYKVLGVPADASPPDIMRGWRKACLRFHPDKHMGKPVEERERIRGEMDAVTAAKQILLEATSRVVHDQTLGVNGYTAWPPPPPPADTYWADYAEAHAAEAQESESDFSEDYWDEGPTPAPPGVLDKLPYRGPAVLPHLPPLQHALLHDRRLVQLVRMGKHSRGREVQF